ncbi:hypothetical protein [Saccharothrix sp. HUAS TT1]|uniref:hypothetical protein n=1 Tax=unclassified Saccharothrix TaxID=2593673 RepID=UPI00345B9DB7
MSIDTAKARGLSVTIKYDKGHDATWAVFTGTPESIRQDIASYFGVASATLADLSLHEIVVNMTQIAHGVTTAATLLGATVIPTQGQTPVSAPPKPGQDVWADAGNTASTPPWQDLPAAPAAPERNPLLDQIAAAPTIPDLQRLWAENQAAFADGALMDAYKARGRALKAATGA